ncbi:MAG: hypothetical protein ABI772_07785 [Bacteroidota bacterium]
MKHISFPNICVSACMQRLLYMVFPVLIALSGCTKYEEVIVPGNVPPPDPTVSSSIYEDYINRSYILTMGREPDSSELQHDLDVLHNGSLSAASRDTFATGVFADADFRTHEYEDNHFELLRETDTLDMYIMLINFDQYLADTANMIAWPYVQLLRDRLQLAYDARKDFVAGTINLKEVHHRLVNNVFYDELNMGSQNFVLAVFQQLINRNPTQNELASGVAMVDGNNAVLFLQSGNTKDDFLNIVFNSNNYYEGQVIKAYQKYLLRIPDTYEMDNGTHNYAVTQDYVRIEKDLIKTNEFVGLK